MIFGYIEKLLYGYKDKDVYRHVYPQICKVNRLCNFITLHAVFIIYPALQK